MSSRSEALTKLGLPDTALPCIGSGYYADVYDLLDGRVLKITRDEEDARTAWHVRRLQMAGGGLNLARVDRVFVLDGMYAIVNEKLDPLPNELYDVAYRNRLSGLIGYTEFVHGCDFVSRGVIGFTANDVPVWQLAALNMYGQWRDLIAAGVTEHSDWHRDNIMWRPAHRDPSGRGRVVLSDFGRSTSPPVEQWDAA